MRRVYGSLLATAAILALPSVSTAQDMEASRKVAGGGISAAGWMGKIDDKEAAAGATLNDAKLTMEGKVLKVTTGPATTSLAPRDPAEVRPPREIRRRQTRTQTSCPHNSRNGTPP